MTALRDSLTVVSYAVTRLADLLMEASHLTGVATWYGTPASALIYQERGGLSAEAAPTPTWFQLAGVVLVRGVNPMPMRSMTRELVAVDAKLRTLVTQLHDNTWGPDELGCIRDDIDEALDRRLVLTSGQARRVAPR